MNNSHVITVIVLILHMKIEVCISYKFSSMCWKYQHYTQNLYDITLILQITFNFRSKGSFIPICLLLFGITIIIY